MMVHFTKLRLQVSRVFYEISLYDVKYEFMNLISSVLDNPQYRPKIRLVIRNFHVKGAYKHSTKNSKSKTT